MKKLRHQVYCINAQEKWRSLYLNYEDDRGAIAMEYSRLLRELTQ
ncbi:hypothetical protein [Allocoleopsis sp.]